MEITVLLAPSEEHGYRASSGPALVAQAEGAICEEALCNLREQIESKLRGTLVGVVGRFTETGRYVVITVYAINNEEEAL